MPIAHDKRNATAVSATSLRLGLVAVADLGVRLHFYSRVANRVANPLLVGTSFDSIGCTLVYLEVSRPTPIFNTSEADPS